MFMATPSVKSHEKQRMLVDQNAKDVAQYIKERSNLKREMSHYCKFEVFLGFSLPLRLLHATTMTQTTKKVTVNLML